MYSCEMVNCYIFFATNIKKKKEEGAVAPNLILWPFSYENSNTLEDAFILSSPLASWSWLRDSNEVNFYKCKLK